MLIGVCEIQSARAEHYSALLSPSAPLARTTLLAGGPIQPRPPGCDFSNSPPVSVLAEAISWAKPETKPQYSSIWASPLPSSAYKCLYSCEHI